MQALTTIPQHPGTTRLEDIEEPRAEEGTVLAQVLQIGVCGTDHEIIDGRYGWAPPGRERPVIGHEAAGPALFAQPIVHRTGASH